MFATITLNGIVQNVHVIRFCDVNGNEDSNGGYATITRTSDDTELLVERYRLEIHPFI